ncbi:MAG TPA: RAMP superfamily CRISPR-associated protein [Pseudothermotoga sp.]|uniref:RAMP superfamily CRISPR-associated protein n=1 Tax=Thermotoga profunda TaxID=1508420 RepID=UPI000597A54D|nr:RAMP superfamily CRISPR-associated protein [Thermotoga profunda]
MIHDYFLSKANIKDFNEWDKKKKDSINDRRKKEERQNMNSDKKKKLYLEEIFIVPLAKEKQNIENESKNKNIHVFYPKKEDLASLPNGSVLIKITFTLKKPYTSKDEGEFHIIDGKIFDNPIVRDKFTNLPMIRPSTWKGHLRFAAERVDCQNKKEIINRLFGSENEDEEKLKGRLYFFPTFFEEDSDKDVITPLKRDTRTPARGPILIEVVKAGSKGEFYLLYVPYPRGRDFRKEQIEEDLNFLTEALKLMFYTYGFSAKKTSGFGVIEELKEENVEIYPEDKKGIFSILYTKHNNIVNDGV